MQKQVSVAIAGLGSRGFDTYANMRDALSSQMKIVAIAEPRPERRQRAKQALGIPDECCFETAEQMFAAPRLADVAFVCTQDAQHHAHAMAALEKGYHLLLEKPISPSAAQCLDIARMAQKAGRYVAVCHVLRYAPIFQHIKQILQSGEIGRTVHLDLTEHVGYWHMAHSFVRGNWRNSALSSPMILAKSCHDMDLIRWLMDAPCETVHSFGSLTEFCEERAPEGAALRCTAGCKAKDTCPYDAEKIYLSNERTGVLRGNTGWPCNVLAMEPNEEAIRQALETGPYGRCVYHADNDVVDHQEVGMRFAGGATAAFTMCAFSQATTRILRIMGTRGDIWADMEAGEIKVCRFLGEQQRCIDVSQLVSGGLGGHAGGDARLVQDLLNLVSGNVQDALGLTGVDVSVESHLMALAAEHSRLHGGQAVQVQDFGR